MGFEGVEEAFKSSPKVFTLSIHHKSPGFFPGELNLMLCLVLTGANVTGVLLK